MSQNKKSAFEARKRYRERHPEKELIWRINGAIKLLQRYGYSVTNHGTTTTI